jgi:hypothetical protein
VAHPPPEQVGGHALLAPLHTYAPHPTPDCPPVSVLQVPVEQSPQPPQVPEQQ